MATKKTGYDASEMTHLEGLDSVRKRVGMYLGSNATGGLQHTVAEIMDNSVDEALAGYCSRIDVLLDKDGSVRVEDNGRGIPVDIHEKSGLPAVIGALTLLHFGGKFGDSGYRSAGGLHGVGSSVVNAVSQRLEVEVYRDNKKYAASFSRGKPVAFKGKGPDAEFSMIEPKKALREEGRSDKGHTGTVIHYWPDPVIFLKEAVITRDYVVNRARQTAFLVPGLEINIKDIREATPYEESFKFDGGIKDMVNYLAKDKEICDMISINGSGVFTENVPMLDDKGHMVSMDVERTVEVSLAMRWGNGYDPDLRSFVNVVSTPHGGTHNKGFERAILSAIRKGYEGTRLLGVKDDPVLLEDVMEGLTAVMSIGFPEPQFVGQTKEELGTAGVLKVVQDIVAQGVTSWIDGKKKAQARIVLEKIANAAKTRISSRTSREASRRKTALEGASMPAKLVDCRTTGVDRSEIFFVEGDSALGSARAARNSEYQALLPLRGKILNVQRASLTDMLNNAECAAIIQCIGAGMGKSFDIEQMRYGKIFLFADADNDGSHIKTLLITFVYKYMRPIIEAGRLYAAMPPLHKIEVLGKGGETIYTYTLEEMQDTVKRLEKAGKKVKSPIQRFKGLGEMSADEISTCLDPRIRSVKRISLGDAEQATATLELLMGNEVAPRRDWIIDNAKRVSREDIDA
jgi:DNA gyrase subunit B